LRLEHIEFSLPDCVAAIQKKLASKVDQNNLRLVCMVAPDVPNMVMGDPGRVGQILNNLVANAIRFTERGVVSLRVEIGPNGANELVLHFIISDTGIGIPAEKQLSIFDAFNQGDNSFTRRFGGTGLGLSICAQLVQMMGGEIWLDSEVGEGSTFHVTLPLSEALPQSTAL